MVKHILFLFGLVFFSSFSFAQHFVTDDPEALKKFAQQIVNDPILQGGASTAGDNGFNLSNFKSVLAKLQEQVDLERRLLTVNEYSENLDLFKKLEEYHISEQKIQNGSYFKYDQDILAMFPNLWAQLENQISSAGGNKDAQLKIVKDIIQNLFQKIANKGPESLLIGIIATLTPDQKSTLFEKKRLSEKIEVLKTFTVTDEQFEAHFDFDKYGEKITFQQSIEELEKRNALTQEFFNHIFFYLHTKNASREDYRDQVEKFLNFDPNQLAELGVELNIPLSDKAQGALFKTYRLNNATKANVELHETQGGFILAELPPYMGIFRGCFGPDCSTTYSWPYPNSPFEKVFYIIKNNQVAGYVTTTLVKVNDENVLLLKDLQGRNVSVEMADSVISFLGTEYIKKFDLKGLYLTNNNFISGNNNYQHIRDALISYMGDPVNVSFRDVEIRGVFSGIARSDGYDAPNVHAKGHVINAKTKTLFHETRPSRYDFFHISEDEKFDKYLRFDKDLIVQALKAKTKEKDVKPYNLSYKEKGFLEKVYKELQNEGPVDLKEFDDMIQKSFLEAYSQEELDQIKKDHPEVFIFGRLKAPDLFRTANLKTLLQIHEEIIYLFKNYDISSYLHLFREKLIDDKDELFIEKLDQVLSEEGGEVAYNNATVLYGNGMGFSENEKINKGIQETIKNDILLNIVSMNPARNNNFRFSTQENVGTFLKGFSYYTGFTIEQHIQKMEETLEEYGVSWEEVAAHPVLSKLAGITFTKTLGLDLFYQDSKDLLSKIPPQIIYEGFKYTREKHVLPFIMTSMGHEEIQADNPPRTYFAGMIHAAELEIFDDVLQSEYQQLKDDLRYLESSNTIPFIIELLYRKKLIDEETFLRKRSRFISHGDPRNSNHQNFTYHVMTEKNKDLLEEYDFIANDIIAILQNMGLTNKYETVPLLILKNVYNNIEIFKNHNNAQALQQNLRNWLNYQESEAFYKSGARTLHLYTLIIWLRFVDDALTDNDRELAERQLKTFNLDQFNSNDKRIYNEIIDYLGSPSIGMCSEILADSAK